MAAPGPFDGLKPFLSGDAFLDLRVGRLTTGEGALHDVAVKLDRRGSRLDIPAIDLATAEGFGLHLEGALQTKGGQGRGQLRLLVEAPDGKALASAVALTGLGRADGPAAVQAAALAPLSLAGTVDLGGVGAAAGAGLVLDGTAGGSQVRVSLRREAGDADWRGDQIDGEADVRNPDAAALLAQLAKLAGSNAVIPAFAVAVPAAKPASLVLRVSGVAEQGLATRASLSAGPISASYDGRVVYDASGDLGADGTAALDTTELRPVLALAGLEKFGGPLSGALSISGIVHREPKLLSFDSVSGRLAEVALRGEATLENSPDLQDRHLTARIDTASLRLDRWLGLLAPAAEGVPAGAGPAAATTGGFWPDRAIDFSVATGLTVELGIATPLLTLADGLTIADARLTVAGTPGKVSLELGGGRLSQGDVKARLDVRKAVAGVEIDLEASLAKARLDQLGGPGSPLPRPEGELAMSFKAAAKGLTPRDLIATATGGGTFEMSEGALAGFSPVGVDAAGRATLADISAVDPEMILRRLAETSRAGAFPFKGAKGKVTIGEGAMRFDRLLVESTQSKLEISNQIGLDDLRLTSTWRQQPKPAEAGKPGLAPVTFTYAGRLADLAGIAASVDAADLKRDLEARRILGEPELSQGIWPVEGSGPLVADTDAAPAIPAPVSPVAAKPAATVSGTILPPATPPVLVPGQSPPAVVAGGPVVEKPRPAAKPAKRPAARKKKATGWTIFDGIFGN